MKRVSSLVGTGVLILTVYVGSASPAEAAARRSHYGLCGAKNMVRAGEGMANAMSRDNENGNLGMSHAVAVSSCPPPA